MYIAVDFDGTCVDHQFPAVGNDVPMAREVLLALVDAGHKLFLNTMRSGDTLAAAVEWFVERGIPLSGINHNPAQDEWTTSTKCYANLFIDDAAFGCPLIQPPGFGRQCVDWKAVSKELLEVKTAIDIAMGK